MLLFFCIFVPLSRFSKQKEVNTVNILILYTNSWESQGFLTETYGKVIGKFAKRRKIRNAQHCSSSFGVIFGLAAISLRRFVLCPAALVLTFSVLLWYNELRRREVIFHDREGKMAIGRKRWAIILRCGSFA